MATQYLHPGVLCLYKLLSPFFCGIPNRLDHVPLDGIAVRNAGRATSTAISPDERRDNGLELRDAVVVAFEAREAAPSGVVMVRCREGDKTLHNLLEVLDRPVWRCGCCRFGPRGALDRVDGVAAARALEKERIVGDCSVHLLLLVPSQGPGGLDNVLVFHRLGESWYRV